MQVVEIWSDFYLDVYIFLESDKITNMDHMRISGTEPSSVVLSQKKELSKVKRDTQKCQNKLEQKGIV